jgi:2-oxoglutarate dehydrogenase E1 component
MRPDRRPSTGNLKVQAGAGDLEKEEEFEFPEPDASTDAFADFGMNAAFVEELHEEYRADPSNVDASWSAKFNGSETAKPANGRTVVASPPQTFREPTAPPSETPSPRSARDLTRPEAPATRADAPQSVVPLDLRTADKYARVLRLIHSYRSRGHRIANSDPLGGHSTYFPELDPAHYGFGNEDLDQFFTAGDLPGGSVQTLREILRRLSATYCGNIGAEYTHIQDPGRKEWLRQRMEESENSPRLSTDIRRRILRKLSEAELFERFLHTKFLGQKRFSLEGAESVIPALDHVVECAPGHGIREIVLGMPHRGRLNVLANVLGKSYESIFSEFEDSPLVDSPFGSGDVKYHKGFSSDRRVASGERVHLSLTSNPSHLEAVDPVVEGRSKAKQIRAGDTEGETVLPLLLHGDAAFAGQGIVTETLNLSQLRGYSTGGTLHLIVNNQIGFTTNPVEARSTLYCTDVAKMIQVPIFHVNGDDPEAVIHCLDLALAYRQRFGCDVVIDLVCYRRHGHNEGDEPSFTQPRLYAKIRQRPSVRKLYTEYLVGENVFDEEDAVEIERKLNAALREALESIKSRTPGPDEPYEPRGPWEGYQRERPDAIANTAVPIERLAKISRAIGTLPSYFHVHPKLEGLLAQRAKSVAENAPLDWAMGEALAFGSLLMEGTHVRLSGQDCSRGTFSHRHAVFVDQDSGEEIAPLDHICETQARFEVYDSLLSETAVLGFEYGYSLADPGSLVLWEAQFGDFANGAQVIIDQFISSAHVKWGRLSGLVLLLPHGYEGQGPEHSSARVERFLQVCAEDCIQVANCTTPAQYFHLLRRQMHREYRAPLVVFTPKSLLRLPAARSSVDEFANGQFQTVIDDPIASQNPDQVRRVLMCCGKVYYDLLEERAQRLGDDAHTVAIVRVEELYPWPEDRIAETVHEYTNSDRLYWVQEEPANMGAWSFVRERIRDPLLPGEKLAYAGRVASASPAVGSNRIHRQQQAALLAAAFEGFE